MSDYIRARVRRELGLDLAVHPVSTVGADESLLVAWFERELAPLFADYRGGVTCLVGTQSFGRLGRFFRDLAGLRRLRRESP
jgi:hypothetical protein